MAKQLKFRPIFHRTGNKCLQKITQEKAFKGRERMMETKHFLDILEFIDHWRAVDLCGFFYPLLLVTQGKPELIGRNLLHFRLIQNPQSAY